MNETPPHLCMIFEATGRFNAIGRIAMAQTEAALDAGWRVSVVAHRLDEALLGRVEWLKLYNPPRGFAVKWLSARHFIKKAMGDPSRFDVIHGHQPQIADLCDIFHCHFLSRMAYENGCLGGVTRTWWNRLVSKQHQLILRAEDRCYRKFNPRTKLVSVSPLITQGFDRLYGLPPMHETLLNAAPPVTKVTPEQRREALAKLGINPPDGDNIVGYIGGMQRRKGYDKVLAGLDGAEGVTVLMAGQGTAALKPGINDTPANVHGIGMAGDTARFYSALDMLVVPSRFDPCPVVIMEAASFGVPVISTSGVGNGSYSAQAGAGVLWDGTNSLADAVAQVDDDLEGYRERSWRFATEQSHSRFVNRFLEMYNEVLARKQPRMTSEAAAKR